MDARPVLGCIHLRQRQTQAHRNRPNNQIINTGDFPSGFNRVAIKALANNQVIKNGDFPRAPLFGVPSSPKPLEGVEGLRPPFCAYSALPKKCGEVRAPHCASLRVLALQGLASNSGQTNPVQRQETKPTATVSLRAPRDRVAPAPRRPLQPQLPTPAPLT